MSFYDDAKFIFLAGGAAGKDGKVYNIKPEEELASELLTNPNLEGDFTLDTNTHANGWVDTQYSTGTITIANNKMTLSVVGDQVALAYAAKSTPSNTTAVLTGGKAYRLQYTVVENNGTTEFDYYYNGDYYDAPHEVGTHYIRFEVPASPDNNLFLFRNAGNDSSIVLENISIKEITTEAADFTFERGTNLTATRVGKDGYIEKGNTQFARNTTWADAGDETAPTGWTDYTNAGGTYDVTSVSGQIRFVTTSAQRAFLISQSFSTKSNYVISVTVDEVATDCDVRQVIGISNTTDTTTLAYFKDGAVISQYTKVEGGSRYSVSINVDTTSAKTFRFGIGAVGATEGDITLSKPQITYGLAPLPYVENTSTTSTKNFGLLEDEPRFDYTGGGCPALLMEPTRTNLVTNSEYFSSWINKPDVTIEYGYAAPDGTNSAAKITETGSNAHIADSFGSTIVDGVYQSIWARTVSGTGTVSLLNQYAEGSVTLTEEWQRFEATQSGPDFMYAVDFRSAANTLTEVLIWGAQAEVGSYATSYIPTYGSSATRNQDVTVELQHGITMGTTCSVFFEGKHLAPNIAQLSFFQLRTDDNNRLLFFGSGTTSSTYNFLVQHRVSGTSTNATSKALNIGDSFKVLARMDDTTMDVFINGELHDTQTITAQDHFGKINLYRTGAAEQSGHAVKQAILFDSVLSTNDSEIITGTSYTNFAAMASELSYTEYE